MTSEFGFVINEFFRKLSAPCDVGLDIGERQHCMAEVQRVIEMILELKVSMQCGLQSYRILWCGSGQLIDTAVMQGRQHETAGSNEVAFCLWPGMKVQRNDHSSSVASKACVLSMPQAQVNTAD